MSWEIYLCLVHNAGVLHASCVLLFWEIGWGAHSSAAYRGLGTKQHSLWALLGDKE